MTDPADGEQLIGLLGRLEHELRENDLWGKRSPDAIALQSPSPFACDTMSFFEWLQWLCLPRLYEVARGSSNHLPTTSEISIATEVFLEREGRVAPNLVTLVQALDDELNARWVAASS